MLVGHPRLGVADDLLHAVRWLSIAPSQGLQHVAPRLNSRWPSYLHPEIDTLLPFTTSFWTCHRSTPTTFQGPWFIGLMVSASQNRMPSTLWGRLSIAGCNSGTAVDCLQLWVVQCNITIRGPGAKPACWTHTMQYTAGRKRRSLQRCGTLVTLKLP